MKKILSTLFLMFAFAGSAFAVDVDVLYLFAPPRCATCKKMESYTQNAVTKMNDKTIHYKAADFSKPENKSYVKKYNLYTKTVILSKKVNGKEQWKNLDKIWDKVKNQSDFENYIIKEVKEFKK